MANREEIRDGILKGCGVIAMLGFSGVVIHEQIIVDEKRKTEYELRRKAEKQEDQRMCALKQEAALFTGRENPDCSHPVIPITYETFLQDAYHVNDSLSPDQEPAWLIRGDDIGKKIDSKKDFTEELCWYTVREVCGVIDVKDDLMGIIFNSFLERCEIKYNVPGINRAAHAYRVLVQEAEYCVQHDLPKIGNDVCYKRAVYDLNHFVRPLAKRTGYVNTMNWQVDEQRVKDISRSATPIQR